MFNKILYSSCALLFSTMLFGISIGHAQDLITSSEITHIAQNDDNVNNGDDDNDMDWGWIGIVGLAGLLGLRRRDKK